MHGTGQARRQMWTETQREVIQEAGLPLADMPAYRCTRTWKRAKGTGRDMSAGGLLPLSSFYAFSTGVKLGPLC